MTVQHNPDERHVTRGSDVEPGIRRVVGRSTGYSRVSDTFARDAALSLRACRIGLYAMSHREGWVMTQQSIARALDLSVTTVRGALDDLAQCGYLRSWTVRAEGRVRGTAYLVHDEPLTDEQWRVEVEAVGGPRDLMTDSVGRESVGTESVPHKGDHSSKGNQNHKGNPSPSPLRGEDVTTGQPSLDGMPDPEPAETAPADEYEAEPGFAEFWSAYPSSKGKRAALLAYRRARKRGATIGAILAGAQGYAAERAGAEARFTAHAATWLNGARYDDVPDTSNHGPARASTARGPSQARALPGSVPTDFSADAVAARNYPDLVLEHEATADRPQTDPYDLRVHRRIADEHGIPFDEYVPRYNEQQAACRRGDWTAFREFSAYLDRMKEQTA